MFIIDRVLLIIDRIVALICGIYVSIKRGISYHNYQKKLYSDLVYQFNELVISDEEDVPLINNVDTDIFIRLKLVTKRVSLLEATIHTIDCFSEMHKETLRHTWLPSKYLSTAKAGLDECCTWRKNLREDLVTCHEVRDVLFNCVKDKVD